MTRAEQQTALKSRDSIKNPPFPVELNEHNPPVYVAKKGRVLPKGLGSLGSRALHIKARVHLLDSDPIHTRLDSGADIMLMSEEYYHSIKGLPKIKEGLRMKLYHLMSNASVLRYIRTTLYATASDGTIISFKLEAYVVRGMRVPLLIGEDFQTTFELGLIHYVSGQSEVKVGREGTYTIDALSALVVDLGFEICQAYVSKSFIRSKAIR